MTEDITLPSLVVNTGKSEFRLRCHAAAWASEYGGQLRVGHRRSRYHDCPGLLVFSATGADTAVKAVRAALYQPDVQAEFVLAGEGMTERMVKATAGQNDRSVVYTAAAAKLASGVIHLVALAKVAGLMPNTSDDHLWAELTSPRYTTPLLRSWIPWLRKTMLQNGGIVAAKGLGSAPTAGVLTIEPDQLDALVSDGVKQGHLRMAAPPNLQRHKHALGNRDELSQPSRVPGSLWPVGGRAC